MVIQSLEFVLNDVVRMDQRTYSKSWASCGLCGMLASIKQHAG